MGTEPAIIATDPLSSELDTDEIDDEDSDPPDEDDEDDDLEDETDEEDDDLDEEDDLEDEEDPSRLDLEDEEDSEASIVSEERTGSSSLPHPGPRRHQYLLDRLHDDSGEDTPPPSSRGRPSESPHHPVDPETQSRLEALLEAAGIGSIEESNPNLADPEVGRPCGVWPNSSQSRVMVLIVTALSASAKSHLPFWTIIDSFFLRC